VRALRRILQDIPSKQAFPVLLEAFKDEDEKVREVVAGALGEIGDGSAVPALVQALGDKNDEVRGAASFSLYCLRAEL